MVSGAEHGGKAAVPGTGTFFVGIDIVPGRYRCPNAEGGRWIRFTGPSGDRLESASDLPKGPTEVDIEASDIAFETDVPSHWRMIARPRRPAFPDDTRRQPREVSDPALPGELAGLLSETRYLRRVRLAQAVLVTTPAAASALASAYWGLVLAPLILIALILRRVADRVRRDGAIRDRRDRFLHPKDLDEDARDLLVRVQAAVEVVQESVVNREGLLDTVDNTVTLAREEWEVARALARQSRLRTEQEAILVPGTRPEVEAALQPLREQLEISVLAVTRRIEALERYAERTRAADDAYRAHQHLQTLVERAPEYEELLADTVRDELAIPVIERLTNQSDEVVRTLEHRLEAASQAGTIVQGDLTRTESGEASG